MVRAGQMSSWDLTTMLWVLLNSGHDGGAADTPKPRGLVNHGAAIADPNLRANLRKLLEKKPDGLRPRRNALFGHIRPWQMPWGTLIGFVSHLEALTLDEVDRRVP